MLTFRRASEADMRFYFDLVNDAAVRQNSINSRQIIFEDHVKWFTNKLADPDTIMLVFSNGDKRVGQLRIEIEPGTNEAIIDYAIDRDSRGKGFGTLILSEGFQYFSRLVKNMPLTGFVKVNNMASISAFVKAGYLKTEGIRPIKNELYFKFSKDA